MGRGRDEKEESQDHCVGTKEKELDHTISSICFNFSITISDGLILIRRNILPPQIRSCSPLLEEQSPWKQLGAIL